MSGFEPHALQFMEIPKDTENASRRGLTGAIEVGI